jgi:GH15 family glucan-1,4-alpha-glucosidase
MQERLISHWLVYRYRTGGTRDGLPDGEATFAPCSFWMSITWRWPVGAGRRAHFERVVGCAYDIGFLAEEIGPPTGELLGNYPLGFTYLALLRVALSIAKSESSEPEEHAETPVERAGRLSGAPARP